MQESNTSTGSIYNPINLIRLDAASVPTLLKVTRLNLSTSGLLSTVITASLACLYMNGVAVVLASITESDISNTLPVPNVTFISCLFG